MRRCVAAFLLVTLAPSAFGWGAYGHRLVTRLALNGLPGDIPAWLKDEKIREQIAFESSEPDRWRGTRIPALIHENDPDHYLDLEDLEPFGLTLDSMPPLRYEYLRALIIAKHVHPEQIPPYDASKDPARSKEWPGFLPYAIAEHYAKLRSAFTTYKTLESLNDPKRGAQLEAARATIIVEMGLLSHFVGDAAQPLHTTRHFNGWVGENPNHYTASKQFHAYIDTDGLFEHKMTYESLKPMPRYGVHVNAQDPWKDVLSYLRRSHELVELVYQLERDGGLKGPTGKAFFTERLCDAADMLAGLFSAAWSGAVINEKELQDFLKYDEAGPPATTQPASSQAAATQQTSK